MGAHPSPFLSLKLSLLSLFITPQQINSLLILISQEITYLISFTPLLLLFFLYTTEHAFIPLSPFSSFSSVLSLNSKHACNINTLINMKIHVNKLICE